MERTQKKPRKAHRQGGIFPVLAVLLTVVTIWSLFSSLFGGSDVGRALEKTKKALEKKEEDTLFLLSLLQDGSVSVDGKTDLSWEASLPKGAALKISEDGNTLSLVENEELLVLEAGALSENARSAVRSGIGTEFADSVFSSEAVSAEHQAAARLFLAVSDPAVFQTRALGDTLQKAIQKAKPSLKTSEGEWKEKSLSGTEYTYSFDSPALVRALHTFAIEAKEKEEAAVSARALYTVVSALGGRTVTREEAQRLTAALTGSGEDFDALSTLMGKAESALRVRFLVCGSTVAAIRWDGTFGEYDLEGSLFFGENIKESAEESLSLSLSKKEDEIFSLSLSSLVTDASKEAFIREWNVSLTDETGFFLPEDAAKDAWTLRYSWGKEKGDIGLRFIHKEEESVLRATLEEYKKGKKFSLTVNRIEKGKENLLKSGSFSLTGKEGGNPPSTNGAELPLFPQGEEKEAFRVSFEEAWGTLFGESQ